MMTLEQFAAEVHLHDGVARGVATQLSKSSQLLPLLNTQKIGGLIHKFSREEGGGGIVRRQINQEFPDSDRSDLVPDDERIEIAGASIKADHRLVKVNPIVRANEIARRTRTLGRYIDRQIIKGNGTADPTQITGLQDKIAADQTIEAGANGAALSLALFQELIDAVEDQGAGRFVIGPKKAVRKLKSLIVAAAGGASVAEATGAIMEYEGVKIFASGKDNDGEEILDYDETQGNSDLTASMYCIAPGDGDDTGTSILMASNSIELIPEGLRGAFYYDTLEVAFGLAIFVWKSAARLKGILDQ